MPASMFADAVRLFLLIFLSLAFVCIVLCLCWWVYCFILMLQNCDEYNETKAQELEADLLKVEDNEDVLIHFLDELDRLFEEKEGE